MSILSPWQRTAAGANLLSADNQLGVTIFEEITTLANRHGAINLGQGFPDTEGPAAIAEIAKQAISDGLNQYAPGSGSPDLRTAVAEHQARFHGQVLDPDTEVVITTGATEGIAAAVLAFVSSGDEVVTFEPFYDSYGATIALSGGVHRTVPLLAPDFQPDPEQLSSVVSDRTRMIILNNPHNPTGAVFGREVLEHIVALAIKHDALILSDEVYEHLTFGVEHIPVSTLEGAGDRTLTLSSAGKTFSFTGWKVGWATGPAHLVAALRTVKQFLSYSSGPAFQPAVAAALRLPTGFFTGFAADLGARGEILATGLDQAGMTVYRPRGTYFIVADVAPLGFTDAAVLARSMPELIGVAGIPLSVFCHPEGADRTRSLMRFAFCKREDVLIEASRRLSRLSDLVGA
ncbi:aminotransferase class I/II-fold pyridoxal phosphate-dependent enzyme [Paeniglutamicibacter cryotolerans]|uniref:N-succinyldiaminopimelate aminotransferase n=1 Tax=Paeniglutamicibacter cryotolerans TaxID=670079 RepID=A0A839QMF4_9MICC|nr:aminotransferase class I/II-fold pyridoxal phosphate-dependent enzyme [Paeniglutamicibacter cryotolerans]MBB2997429.1 N-succinyldiaminopimelate aminotransferase [Paeniglutamicibacter cryotolerans]